MKAVKLGVKLTVVSDYLHVTNPSSPPCSGIKLERYMTNFLPFTCFNGEPVLYGSTVKGAVRARADLLLPIPPSEGRTGSGGFQGKKRREMGHCDEVRIRSFGDWHWVVKRRMFDFECCAGKGRTRDHASWRHVATWYEEVTTCAWERFQLDHDLKALFGTDDKEVEGKRVKTVTVPSLTSFSLFRSNNAKLEILRLKLGKGSAHVEAVPQGTTFEGEVTLLDHFNRAKDFDKLLAALLFSLGVFKKDPIIMLGRFKYRRSVPVIQGRPVTFGRVKVEITRVESFGVRVPSDPNELVARYKEVFKKKFLDVDPEVDELMRYKQRVKA